MEQWKPIEGFEGYEVSTEGRVRSLDRRDCRGNRIKGTIIKPRKINSGYLIVHVRDKNGKRAGKLVHRLVAKAFIENPEMREQVDHIDEDKTNNAASNLRWTTPKENTNNGTGIYRAAIGRSRPVVQIEENGKVINTYLSATEAARQLGIKQGSITNCCRGRHEHAGGFRWEYA